MHYQLTLNHLDQGQAFLTDKQGQNFVWPANQLPDDSQIGTVFTCVLVNPSHPDESSNGLAKNILNELLKID